MHGHAQGTATTDHASASTATTAPAAQVTCRTFRGGQRLGIALCVLLPFQATGLATALALPVWAHVPLLLATGALCLGWFAGPCRYTATARGLRREHRRFLGRTPQVASRAWTDVVAWKHDTERGRDGREYEYLELDARRGQRWVVTSRQDPGGFAAFCAFVVPRLQDPTPAGASTSGADAPPPPRRRGSFYTSLQGRLVTVLLTLAAAALLVADHTGALDRGAAFRLEYTILPGVAWLLWRSFGTGARPLREPSVSDPPAGSGPRSSRW
jgi:hypothetical protein